MKLSGPLQLLTLCCALSLVSCADPPVGPPETTVRAVASSRSVAERRVVVFPEIRGETAGIAAEHNWTAQNLPGWRWQSRDVMEDYDGRVYHRVILANDRGRETTIYFDVTNWYDLR